MKLNRFLGKTALILTILLIASVAFGSFYVSSNKSIWNALNFNVYNGSNFNFNFSFNGKRSSTFETLTTKKSDNFETVKDIVINVAVDNVSFVKEDRSDILVDYNNEHPDTPLYSTSYSSKETNGKLYINSTYSVSNLFIDKKYDSSIVIHVPNNYEADSLDLTMSMGDITDKSIYDNTKNLIIHANLGSVDVDITKPKNSLSVSCDMGDIDITLDAPVDTFDANANFGKISIKNDDKIGNLWCDLDMGSLDIHSSGTINNVSLSAKMGSIEGIFNGFVNKMTATANMGSIDLYFKNNDNSTVYADASAGSIHSELQTVKESNNPDFKFYANMGSINIRSH